MSEQALRYDDRPEDIVTRAEMDEVAEKLREMQATIAAILSRLELRDSASKTKKAKRRLT